MERPCRTINADAPGPSRAATAHRTTAPARRHAIIALLITAVTAGCGLRQQIGEMRVFGTSSFRIVAADRVDVAGVDVRHVRGPDDLRLVDVARLVAAGAGGSLPLDLTFIIEARNPSLEYGSMQRFDWRMRIDGEEIAEGASEQTVALPPESAATFPLSLRTELLVQGGERDAIVDMVVGLVDPTRPARLTLQIRPTFEVGGRQVRSPAYFTVASMSNAPTSKSFILLSIVL